MARYAITEKYPKPVRLRWRRVLIVDQDLARSRLHASLLEKAGASEPSMAANGDEALDVLGAAAQQFDLVAAWMPLADDADVDLIGVLRRNRSPVKVLVVTSLNSDDYRHPGRLVGATHVARVRFDRDFLSEVRYACDNGWSVGDIVDRQRAPDLLFGPWATRIYGARPGAPFPADKLD